MKKIMLIFGVAVTMMSCGSNESNQAQVAQANKTADSLQMEMVKQHTIDSMNAIAAQPQNVSNEPSSAVATTPHHSAGVVHNHYTSTTTNNTYSAAGNAPAATTATTTTSTTEEKKGWSAKAKGAVIGAGAGAIGGALIDSKHKGDAVKGGVIGGVLGAAAGLGAGAIIDNKNKKKDAADQDK